MSADVGYLIGYELALVTVERLSGGDRDVVWGSMTYACAGRSRNDGYDLPACGHEERYYLGIGVEGPRTRREHVDRVAADLGDTRPPPSDEFWLALRRELALTGATIPAPFGAGRCPVCYGGEMRHVRFGEDEDFGETFLPPPPGSRYFRVPDAPRAAYSARFENYGGAELVAAPAEGNTL